MAEVQSGHSAASPANDWYGLHSCPRWRWAPPAAPAEVPSVNSRAVRPCNMSPPEARHLVPIGARYVFIPFLPVRQSACVIVYFVVGFRGNSLSQLPHCLHLFRIFLPPELLPGFLRFPLRNGQYFRAPVAHTQYETAECSRNRLVDSIRGNAPYLPEISKIYWLHFRAINHPNQLLTPAQIVSRSPGRMLCNRSHL